MIIITDLLKGPFDEGAKIATRNLIEQIKVVAGAYVISINTNQTLSCVDKSFWVNKLLFSFPFYKYIQKHNGKILYVPESSATFFSFVRAKLINFFTRKNIFILSLQPRKYGVISKLIIKIIQPSCVITQTRRSSQYLSKFEVKNKIISLGVDDSKYYEFDLARKRLLRNSHKYEDGKIVLLHVGHIQVSRNLQWLVDVKEARPEVEIIIVGSTYNLDDEKLYNTLLKKGIRVVREFTPNMEEIYNLVDYYVFPVQRSDGAIETPLSVLEAMACNLPVITSRFGSLRDVFIEDDDFHYVQSAQEIIGIIDQPRSNVCNNREKITPFTWKEIARQLVEIVVH